MITCAGCGRDRSDDVVHDRETRGVRLPPCPKCGSTSVAISADDPEEALVEHLGLDRGLVEHMLKRQLDPQLRAEALREQGVEMDTVFVTTNPEREGYKVTCNGCGRTAKLPFQPPEGKVALCPDCMRAGRTGQP